MTRAMTRQTLRHALLFLASMLLIAGAGIAQTRTITYRWLNQPCAEMINCEGGCSACNLPEEQDAVVIGTNAALIGTNAALIGVEACPFPESTGDNALWLTGWSTVPNDAHRIVINGIALVPVVIDSVIIVHRAAADGPARFAARFLDPFGTMAVELDQTTSAERSESVLKDCGALARPDGAPYSTFQLQLQAYQGTGAWILDEVRVVVSEREQDITTGVVAVRGNGLHAEPTPAVDVLGRTLGMQPGSGLRIGGRSVLVVQ